MYKSQLFTFGFLLCSLVMLVLVPFFNNNSFFSNVMAQEYDKYGDSSYSQYPTDEKPYECRTGPLEGFFVSSVEFCKHVKFDDDKNRKDHNRDSGTGSGNNNSTLVNTFNCINNNNININTDNNSSSSSSNGLQPIQDTIVQGLNGTLDGLSLNKTIINLCFINDNDNITIIEAGNETTPIPPTQPTRSLTVNKEIFGCNNIIIIEQEQITQMDCTQLENDDPAWLPCIGSEISNTPLCQNLPPNLFDIEVLGEIQQFEGSTAGTTIQDFQTDTFIVNEIVHQGFANQQLNFGLFENRDCQQLGFDGGGRLSNMNTQTDTFYTICFEYEDEQGNDCNPITIGAGEEKTCTVKNHILSAQQQPAQQTVTSTAAFEQQPPEDSPIISQGIKGSPTIVQGTEENSSALEKVEKLKAQWMELYQ